MTTSTRPDLNSQPPWPADVTARIVTRIGMTLRNPEATVDIHTRPGLSHDVPIHHATCQPCGWTTDPETKRNTVVDKAQEHADGCTALPQPTN